MDCGVQRFLVLTGDKSDGEAAVALSRLDTTDYHEVLRVMIKQAIARYSAAKESAAWIAELSLKRGDQDQVFNWSEKAFDDRSPWLPYLIVDPAWGPLRSDARFQNILRRMNLRP
jgi:hypothetical protein